MTRIATISGPNGPIISFSSEAAGPWPQLHLETVSGWFGGVGVKDTSTPRMGHGVFSQPTRFTGRGLTVYGFTKYETDEERHILERGFSSVLADGETYRLTVEIDGHALWCDVKQDGEIGVASEGVDLLNVVIPLEAEDPRVYAEEHRYQLFPAGFGEGLVYPLFADGVLDYGDVTPGSSVPVRNGGTARAYPRFEVQGNWPSGFRITSGQDVVEYGAPVLGRETLVVDMRTGSIAVKNGGDRTHLATRRSWFGVDPGQTIQPRLAAVGEGTGFADVYLADTYL